jgi:hypothetical protein
LAQRLQQVAGDVQGRCSQEVGQAVAMEHREGKPYQPCFGPERPLKLVSTGNKRSFFSVAGKIRNFPSQSGLSAMHDILVLLHNILVFLAV